MTTGLGLLSVDFFSIFFIEIGNAIVGFSVSMMSVSPFISDLLAI